MTTFNQQGQHVQNQYNAGGNINIEPIRDQQDLITRLEQLELLVKKAVTTGDLDTKTGEAVSKELKQASSGEKKTIIERLSKAKDLLKGITAAESIASIMKALIKSISNWI